MSVISFELEQIFHPAPFAVQLGCACDVQLQRIHG